MKPRKGLPGCKKEEDPQIWAALPSGALGAKEGSRQPAPQALDKPHLKLVMTLRAADIIIEMLMGGGAGWDVLSSTFSTTFSEKELLETS